MEALIGGPLIATAQANSEMAVTQMNFLLETCFVKEGEDGKFEPIMVEMKISRPVINADGEPKDSVETNFTIPLLTLLPLNSLGVDNVQIHFEMEVKSAFAKDNSSSTEKTKDKTRSYDSGRGFWGCRPKISGTVSSSRKSSTASSDHYEKSNQAKYTVDVHAGQLPLPEGVNTVIQAFTESIAPIQVPATSADPGGDN
ncbi:DUF2589 domain-containing protein [Endozoicomonas lisbonensis]